MAMSLSLLPHFSHTGRPSRRAELKSMQLTISQKGEVEENDDDNFLVFISPSLFTTIDVSFSLVKRNAILKQKKQI